MYREKGTTCMQQRTCACELAPSTYTFDCVNYLALLKNCSVGCTIECKDLLDSPITCVHDSVSRHVLYESECTSNHEQMWRTTRQHGGTACVLLLLHTKNHIQCMHVPQFNATTYLWLSQLFLPNWQILVCPWWPRSPRISSQST